MTSVIVAVGDNRCTCVTAAAAFDAPLAEALASFDDAAIAADEELIDVDDDDAFGAPMAEAPFAAALAFRFVGGGVLSLIVRYGNVAIAFKSRSLTNNNNNNNKKKTNEKQTFVMLTILIPRYR